MDLGAGAAREPVRAPERRPQHAALRAARAAVDGCRRSSSGLASAPARRMSASRPANADRGSTSSAPAWRAAAIEIGVDVRGEADRAESRSSRVRLERRDRGDGSVFWLFRSKMTRRRLQRRRLREDLVGRARELDLDAHVLRGRADLRAEEEDRRRATPESDITARSYHHVLGDVGFVTRVSRRLVVACFVIERHAIADAPTVERDQRPAIPAAPPTSNSSHACPRSVTTSATA